MHIALVIVHVIACFAIMGIVLLQAGKGADIGSAFGGAGSQAVFGSMGTPTVLGKITTAVAILFTITSFTLALMGGEPLLRPDFIHKITYYAAKKDFFVYLPTNGRLMRPEVIDRIGDAGVDRRYARVVQVDDFVRDGELVAVTVERVHLFSDDRQS